MARLWSVNGGHVGLFDKASAAARLAAEQIKATSVEVVKEFDAGWNDNSDYRNLRQTGQELLRAGRKYAEDGRAYSNEVLLEFGETRAGGSTGDTARRIGRGVNALPVLSAIVDTFKARHGIEALVARLADDPDDPIKAVQLAEGMSRVAREMTHYRRVRSVVSPTYAIRRQLIVGTVGLGLGDGDSTVRSLNKRAFVQSRQLLSIDPTNTNALHSLARVYLNEGSYKDSLRTGKLAVLTNPADADVWITIARCYLALDIMGDAELSANRAAAMGQSYAYEVLAAIALIQAEGGISETSTRFEKFRASVQVDDRCQYLGAPLDAKSAWESLLGSQWAKGERAWSRTKEWMEGS